MDFAIVYLARRFLYHTLDFFHHWYVDGSRAIGRRFISTLGDADRSLALKVTLLHFFEPLYKDYTIVGRILGFVFRFFRIIIGAIFYLFLTLFFALIYLVWIAIPVIIFYYVARNL